jgi:hypothetical protein
LAEILRGVELEQAGSKCGIDEQPSMLKGLGHEFTHPDNFERQFNTF